MSLQIKHSSACDGKKYIDAYINNNIFLSFLLRNYRYYAIRNEYSYFHIAISRLTINLFNYERTLPCKIYFYDQFFFWKVWQYYEKEIKLLILIYVNISFKRYIEITLLYLFSLVIPKKF